MGPFKSDCMRNKETFAEVAIASNLNAASFNTLKMEHGQAAGAALQKLEQELATKKNE